MIAPRLRSARTPQSDTEWVYELRTREVRGDTGAQAAFDRVAFARRVLAILRPAKVSVAVYPSSADLRVEKGRAWSHGPDAEWAMVAIPGHATRAEIVLALAELSGLARQPFLVDLLASLPFEA
ncbi:MAG: hypothetical protein ACHREM_17100 [Polyangiales bacterium]